MPTPGTMVNLSPTYTPAYLKGLVIHPDNALKFDFLIDKGEGNLTQQQKRQEYNKLVKYFLASLTVAEKDQWVNLSPYEKDRIIEDSFGRTEMGRDLLAQDYLLKQITSSLMYPESELGKSFWAKVYERAYKEFGNTNIPVNTFNKVWIVPDEAVIHESGNTAYIVKNHLKVMLEEDYLAHTKNTQGARPSKDVSSLNSQIIREIILPELEREVNEGKNFALLRQITSGMLLATWYKKVRKESLLGKVYADRNKVEGIVSLRGAEDPEAIYQKYLQAFKKGVYNYIKDDVDPYSKEAVARKYFAGGFSPDYAMVTQIRKIDGKAMAAQTASLEGAEIAEVVLKEKMGDAAMSALGRQTPGVIAELTDKIIEITERYPRKDPMQMIKLQRMVKEMQEDYSSLNAAELDQRIQDLHQQFMTVMTFDPDNALVRKENWAVVVFIRDVLEQIVLNKDFFTEDHKPGSLINPYSMSEVVAQQKSGLFFISGRIGMPLDGQALDILPSLALGDGTTVEIPEEDREFLSRFGAASAFAKLMNRAVSHDGDSIDLSVLFPSAAERPSQEQTLQMVWAVAERLGVIAPQSEDHRSAEGLAVMIESGLLTPKAATAADLMILAKWYVNHPVPIQVMRFLFDVTSFHNDGVLLETAAAALRFIVRGLAGSERDKVDALISEFSLKPEAKQLPLSILDNPRLAQLLDIPQQQLPIYLTGQNTIKGGQEEVEDIEIREKAQELFRVRRGLRMMKKMAEDHAGRDSAENSEDFQQDMEIFLETILESALNLKTDRALFFGDLLLNIFESVQGDYTKFGQGEDWNRLWDMIPAMEKEIAKPAVLAADKKRIIDSLIMDIEGQVQSVLEAVKIINKYLDRKDSEIDSAGPVVLQDIPSNFEVYTSRGTLPAQEAIDLVETGKAVIFEADDEGEIVFFLIEGISTDRAELAAVDIFRKFKKIDDLGATLPVELVLKSLTAGEAVAQRLVLRRQLESKGDFYLANATRITLAPGLTIEGILKNILQDLKAKLGTPEAEGIEQTDGYDHAESERWKVNIRKADHLVVIDKESGTEKDIADIKLRRLHTVTFSPADPDVVLLSSFGSDRLVELDLRSGRIIWEWNPWNHGFAKNKIGLTLMEQGEFDAQQEGARWVTDAEVENMLAAKDSFPSDKKYIYEVDLLNQNPTELKNWQRTFEPNWSGYNPRDAGKILATSYALGQAVEIDKKTGEARIIADGLINPHGVIAFGGSFLITDTGRGQVRALDKDFGLKQIFDFSKFPVRAQEQARTYEWLQHTFPISDTLLATVDSRRNMIYVWDMERRVYGEYRFDGNYVVQAVKGKSDAAMNAETKFSVSTRQNSADPRKWSIPDNVLEQMVAQIYRKSAQELSPERLETIVNAIKTALAGNNFPNPGVLGRQIQKAVPGLKVQFLLADFDAYQKGELKFEQAPLTAIEAQFPDKIEESLGKSVADLSEEQIPQQIADSLDRIGRFNFRQVFPSADSQESFISDLRIIVNSDESRNRKLTQIVELLNGQGNRQIADYILKSVQAVLEQTGRPQKMDVVGIFAKHGTKEDFDGIYPSLARALAVARKQKRDVIFLTEWAPPPLHVVVGLPGFENFNFDKLMREVKDYDIRISQGRPFVAQNLITAKMLFDKLIALTKQTRTGLETFPMKEAREKPFVFALEQFYKSLYSDKEINAKVIDEEIDFQTFLYWLLFNYKYITATTEDDLDIFMQHTLLKQAVAYFLEFNKRRDVILSKQTLNKFEAGYKDRIKPIVVISRGGMHFSLMKELEGSQTMRGISGLFDPSFMKSPYNSEPFEWVGYAREHFPAMPEDILDEMLALQLGVPAVRDELTKDGKKPATQEIMERLISPDLMARIRPFIPKDDVNPISYFGDAAMNSSVDLRSGEDIVATPVATVIHRHVDNPTSRVLVIEPIAIAPGGIDLNSANLNLQIKRDGKGVPLPLTQQDLAQLSRIRGFEPVILEIKPATALPLLSNTAGK